MKSILIVDRDKQLRSLYEMGLGNEGYRTYSATSAGSALQFLKKNDSGIDLIIMDIGVLSAGGMELLEMMIREHKDMNVILSSDFPSNRRNSMTWLADAFIVKSPDLSELKQTVMQLVPPPN